MGSQLALYHCLLFHLHHRVEVLLLLDETLSLNPGGVHVQGSHNTVTTEEEVPIAINNVLSQPFVLSCVFFVVFVIIILLSMLASYL